MDAYNDNRDSFCGNVHFRGHPLSLSNNSRFSQFFQRMDSLVAQLDTEKVLWDFEVATGWYPENRNPGRGPTLYSRYGSSEEDLCETIAAIAYPEIAFYDYAVGRGSSRYIWFNRSVRQLREGTDKR